MLTGWLNWICTFRLKLSTNWVVVKVKGVSWQTEVELQLTHSWEPFIDWAIVPDGTLDHANAVASVETVGTDQAVLGCYGAGLAHC